jgi:hypothetical protein
MNKHTRLLIRFFAVTKTSNILFKNFNDAKVFPNPLSSNRINQLIKKEAYQRWTRLSVRLPLWRLPPLRPPHLIFPSVLVTGLSPPSLAATMAGSEGGLDVYSR